MFAHAARSDRAGVLAAMAPSGIVCEVSLPEARERKHRFLPSSVSKPGRRRNILSPTVRPERESHEDGIDQILGTLHVAIGTGATPARTQRGEDLLDRPG